MHMAPDLLLSHVLFFSPESLLRATRRKEVPWVVVAPVLMHPCQFHGVVLLRPSALPSPTPPVLCCRSPDLEEDPFLFFFHESHRGGGFKEDGKWSLRSHLRGCGSSTPATMVELWRPLWLPASSTLPVNPMAERRPFRAMATGLHRPLLVLFLPASMPKGRQCINGFESISSISGGRRSGGDPGIPSGLVPGDDGCVSELLLLFGPDCNSRSWVRVLSACSRDLYVIFYFSLGLVVRCCVPPPEI